MIRYCVVKDNKKRLLIQVKSDLSFGICEAEKWLEEDYPGSKVKCFVSSEKAIKYLISSKEEKNADEKSRTNAIL